MKEELIRTEMLLGRAAIERLQHSHVAVFGIGGVGGYVTEVLARSGVGELTLIDSDRVNRSNINRQIIATHETVGRTESGCRRGTGTRYLPGLHRTHSACEIRRQHP